VAVSDDKRERHRAALERWRRRQGMKPQAESLERRAPWKRMGIGRSTWYRHGYRARSRPAVTPPR
jgi:hypothetical protein